MRPNMSMTISRSAGSLVSRAWELPSDASRSSIDQLRAKKIAERAALKQLVSLRREVQDRKLDSAAQRLRERRWSEAAAYKAEIRKERPMMHDVSAADEATVFALSKRLNQAMAVLEPDANKRGWFRLFRHMDNFRRAIIGAAERLGTPLDVMVTPSVPPSIPRQPMRPCRRRVS